MNGQTLNVRKTNGSEVAKVVSLVRQVILGATIAISFVLLMSALNFALGSHYLWMGLCVIGTGVVVRVNNRLLDRIKITEYEQPLPKQQPNNNQGGQQFQQRPQQHQQHQQQRDNRQQQVPVQR